MKIRKNDIFLYGRKMLFQMLEILYPRRCAVCDEIEVTGKGICPLCKDKVHVAGEPACKKCGKPLVEAKEKTREQEEWKKASCIHTGKGSVCL